MQYLPHPIRFLSTHRIVIISDPDDNKFVDCAITAKAKYIVTQDRHYDVVRFNPKYDFTAIDIDYFLHELQEVFGK